MLGGRMKVKQNDQSERMMTRNRKRAKKEEGVMDKEISFITCERLQMDGCGLNRVEADSEGFEVMRSEMLPIDNIGVITGHIGDFNSGQVDHQENDTDGEEDVLSEGEENKILNFEEGDEKDKKENRFRMEEMVMEGQRKCKETQEIIQIVLNELECTEVELKSRSEYVRSIMKERRSLCIAKDTLFISYTNLAGFENKLMI